jgi:hypothetical protein
MKRWSIANIRSSNGFHFGIIELYLSHMWFFFFHFFSKQSQLRISPNDIEIGESLGAGGFGVVSKGVWKGRGGHLPVAIKQVVHYTTLSISPTLSKILHNSPFNATHSYNVD